MKEKKRNAITYAVAIMTVISISILLLAGNAIAGTFYIAANGADTNSGTSKSSPWLHAPNMTGCSNNCASYTPQPGDNFILRGGDTWYPSGAGTPVGLPWNLSTTNGTSSSWIYIGVDETWYVGSSWTRPMLNGGNPLSTTAVSSCAYSAGSRNVFVNCSNPVGYVQLDNIEFLGLCWSGTPIYGNSAYISSNCGILSNLYFHGWTHTSFSSGTNDYGRAIVGTTNSTVGEGDTFTHLTFDGTDSDPTSLAGIFGDCYDLNNSTFRYLSNGAICNNMHLFYNNLFEYISESSDPAEHSNGFEFNSVWSQGTSPNLVYNNTVRHMQTAVTTWINPNTTLATYVYNNLIYDVLQEPVNVCGGAECSDGIIYIMNNTVESGAATPFDLQTASAPTFVNNHCINTVGACTDGTSTPTALTNLVETETVAAAAGYTEANQYVPASSSGPTVGQGTNEYSTVNTAGLPTTDILGNPRPSSRNWDIGAYELATGGLAPPTGVYLVPPSQ